MTAPQNLAEAWSARRKAGDDLLAAIAAEHTARLACPDETDDTPEVRAWDEAYQARNKAEIAYMGALNVERRIAFPPEPQEPTGVEVYDCPGGAYIICRPADSDPDVDPIVADGRAADEFYGRDA